MLEAVIFDLDGTLWDATEGILNTWNDVIAAHPESQRGKIGMEELSAYLGLPMTEIADRMFPACTAEQKQLFMDECCEQENVWLGRNGGKLYPKLISTLQELKKEYRLFIVSNCQKGYIESFLQAHKAKELFDDILCWGDTLLSKGENNKLIMLRNGITKAVYVGDTAGDENSARVAQIPFIFASYGFGDAVAPDYILQSFADLPKILRLIK